MQIIAEDVMPGSEFSCGCSGDMESERLRYEVYLINAGFVPRRSVTHERNHHAVHIVTGGLGRDFEIVVRACGSDHCRRGNGILSACGRASFGAEATGRNCPR